MVEDPLSEKLLWKEFTAGQLVVVDAENGEIAFRSLDRPTEEIDVPPAELAGKE
jgi:ATP-dependent Clp protease ATP-binding subunit ClpC